MDQSKEYNPDNTHPGILVRWYELQVRETKKKKNGNFLPSTTGLYFSPLVLWCFWKMFWYILMSSNPKLARMTGLQWQYAPAMI